MSDDLTPGDEWPNHYRGYRLQTNAEGDVWWQVYQGEERLTLDPTPDGLVDDLLSVKRLGGRIRVTEDNAVIARIEEGGEYKAIYVGELSLAGEYVPPEDPEFSVQVRPSGLSNGDLWPTVYDGAKYAFIDDRVWWQHPGTHQRHPVETSLPTDVLGSLQRLKPRGGSFIVTPWNDVVTLVEDPPNPEQTREQLHDLPRVIKNIIVLRRERGVEMLPIYVGSIEDVPLEVSEPRSLTDELSPEERAQLDSWAGSVGQTVPTDPDDHKVRDPAEDMPSDDPESW